MNPFFSKLDFKEAKLLDYDNLIERRLKDIKPYIKDKDTLERRIIQNNELVYKVFQRIVPKEEGHLQHSITIIKPGTINGECFMTRGHYHSNPKSAEIYICLKGKGLLVMQNGEEVKTIEMERGIIAYIPPGWSHRTVNVGNKDFVFMAIFPGDAGYDYDRVRKEGINIRIYKTDIGYKKVRHSVKSKQKI